MFNYFSIVWTEWVISEVILFIDRTLFSSSHLFRSFLFLVKQFRFTLLCHAACEAPLVLPLGGFTYGEKCLFVVNDWHAGLVPVYVICLPVIPFLHHLSICFISVDRMFSCFSILYFQCISSPHAYGCCWIESCTWSKFFSRL